MFTRPCTSVLNTNILSRETTNIPKVLIYLGQRLNQAPMCGKGKEYDSCKHMVLPFARSVCSICCQVHHTDRHCDQQHCVNVCVSVRDSRRGDQWGTLCWVKGVWGRHRTGGCWGEVGGTGAPEGRKEKGREYSHYPPRAIPLWPISCWRP